MASENKQTVTAIPVVFVCPNKGSICRAKDQATMASKKSRVRKYRPLRISRTKYFAGMAALISFNVLDDSWVCHCIEEGGGLPVHWNVGLRAFFTVFTGMSRHEGGDASSLIPNVYLSSRAASDLALDLARKIWSTWVKAWKRNWFVARVQRLFVYS